MKSYSYKNVEYATKTAVASSNPIPSSTVVPTTAVPTTAVPQAFGIVKQFSIDELTELLKEQNLILKILLMISIFFILIKVLENKL